MKLSELFFAKTKELWDEAANKPFVIEMAKGTLIDRKFRNYTLQETQIPSDTGSEMQSGYSRTIMDGDYAIVSALNTDYFLDIIGADMPAGNGTNVSLWNRYSSGGVIGANNIWTVKYENGFYTLKKKDT